MSEPDVVARLRSWVTDWNGAAMVRGEPPRDGLHCDVLYDAIDALAAARTQALEEAARVCEGGYTMGSTASTLQAVAAAIRALKEKS